MTEFIENLTLKNLRIDTRHYTPSLGNVLYYEFTINSYSFYLYTEEKAGKLFLGTVEHHEQIKDCPMCSKGMNAVCSVLTEHTEELYQRIIHHPSIRLRYLFMQKNSEGMSKDG